MLDCNKLNVVVVVVDETRRLARLATREQRQLLALPLPTHSHTRWARMSDSDDDAAIARLEEQLAIKKERKRAREDEQRRREALMPKQLVPDSPSPSALHSHYLQSAS